MTDKRMIPKHRQNIFSTICKRNNQSSNTEIGLMRDLDGHLTHLKKMSLFQVLEGHDGCVNCLEWNKSGTLLASGSDDLFVYLWDPFRGKSVHKIETGHHDNIFSVKFVGECNDTKIITGAMDGQVNFLDVNRSERLNSFTCSQSSYRRRVKRLCSHPNSPFIFWSALEEGTVRQYDLRQPHKCQSNSTPCTNVLIDMTASCGTNIEAKCLDVCPTNPHLLAVGGSDPFIRLYDMRKLSLGRLRQTGVTTESRSEAGCIRSYCPHHIATSYQKKEIVPTKYRCISATYVSFNSLGTELLAYMNPDHLYLYNITDPTPPLKYHSDTFKPNFTTNSPLSNGFSKNPYLLCTPTSSLIHQSKPSLWTVRSVDKQKELGNKAYNEKNYLEAISHYNQGIFNNPYATVLYSNRAAAFFGRSWSGDAYACLRDCETALQLEYNSKKCKLRRIKSLHELGWVEEAYYFLNEYLDQYPEMINEISDWKQKVESAMEKTKGEKSDKETENKEKTGILRSFANQLNSFDYSSRFVDSRNSATDIKEAIFIGYHGNFIASGSDDGNIYIWEKSTGNLITGFHGDHNIVNCVQWNPNFAMLASSGIENTVKIWSVKGSEKYDALEVSELRKQSVTNQSPVNDFSMFFRGLDMELLQDGSADNTPVCRPS